MSSKKKQARDKQLFEETAAAAPAARPDTDWLLAAAPSLEASSFSPAFASARHIVCGRPHGALSADGWQQRRAVWLAAPLPGAHDSCSRREALTAWGEEIAARLPSAVLSPHHTLHLAVDCAALTAGSTTMSSGSVSTLNAAATIAAAVRRLVVAHTRLTNASCATSLAYSPAADVESLLGCTIRATGGYRGPEVELPQHTFDAAHKTISTAGRRLRMVRHPDATHVVVCCGPFYYQLTVVDAATGGLQSEAQLAAGLEAIRAHAAHTSKALNTLDISDEDRTELRETRSLLARLSTVHDDTSADAHRRLREVSAVNAHSLAQLDGGLFTVVLRDSDYTKGRLEEQSQWLYSALSLSATLGHSVADEKHEDSTRHADAPASAPTVMEMVVRVHAMAAALPTVQAFVLYAFSEANPPPKADPPAPRAELIARHPFLLLESRRAAAAASPESDVGAASMTVSTRVDKLCVSPAYGRKADFCTPLGDDGTASYLELWLPHRHRLPLLTLAESIHTPAWKAVPVPPTDKYGNTSLAEVCLGLILAATSGGATNSPQVPCMLVSLLVPETVGPVTQRLESDAITQYLRVADSASLLVTPAVRREARRAALESVAALLQCCWVRASEGLAAEPRAAADVNIAVAVTPRSVSSGAARAHGSHVRLRACATDTGVPAALQIRCHAVQVAAEKSLTLPYCHVGEPLSIGASALEHAEAANALAARAMAALTSLKTRDV